MRLRNFSHIFLLLLVVACASKSDLSTSSKQEENTSSADLIDPIEEDANALNSSLFSELKSNDSTEENVAVSDSPALVREAPFYTAIGGESLGRVAYLLYGSKKAVKDLYKENPELKGQRKLETEQKIYFSFENINPEPVYLTKDLLDRYKKEFSAKIQNTKNIIGEENTAVVRGDTLQKISQRIYGTTRYWTELYLLNQEKIANYDRLPAGIEITYFKRTEDQIAVHPKAVVASPAQEPAQDVLHTPPMPDVTAKAESLAISTEELNLNPESDRQEQAAVAIAPPPLPPPLPQEEIIPMPSSSTVLPPPTTAAENNSNNRRMIYVGLILVIALGAFYMTRPSKRKFDMVEDVSTQGGQVTPPGISSRQKLKESNVTQDSKKNIG